MHLDAPWRARCGRPQAPRARARHRVHAFRPTRSSRRSASSRAAQLFSWISGLQLDGSGLVVDAETGRTGNDQYYAAGDAINGGASAVEAVGAAKRVARAIEEALS